MLSPIPSPLAPVLDWLLEADPPGVRYLALRDLLGRPADDPELQAAQAEALERGPIAAVLDAMQPEGWWEKPGPGYNPKYRSTVWALILLAELGATAAMDERVARACAYLLDHALAPGGQFGYNGSAAGTIDCLQGNLCWALAAMDYEDERLETAFDWLARSVTGEGVAPVGQRGAERRYYAYNVGPDFACAANNRLPCAWGGAKVMLALSAWPAGRRTPQIEAAIARGLDFFFSVDPATALYPTPSGGPPNRAWWKFGFPVFYITDLLQVVEALAALGCGADPRLANAVEIVRSKADAQGRWPLEYNYASKTWGDYGKKNAPSKWVTVRALRALKAVEG